MTPIEAAATTVSLGVVLWLWWGIKRKDQS